MNPTGKNEYFDENIIDKLDGYADEFFKRFTIIATSLTDF
jgi:hypothetical protein